MQAVLLRLVPLQRGLFEDYVANFWCASHTLVKWKRLLSLPVRPAMCSLPHWCDLKGNQHCWQIWKLHAPNAAAMLWSKLTVCANTD